VIDDDETASQLEDYDPESISPAEWVDAIDELEQLILEAKPHTPNPPATHSEPSNNSSVDTPGVSPTHQWIAAHPDQATDRLVPIIDTDAYGESVADLISDAHAATDWMAVWAKWESLRNVSDISREPVAVSEIKGVGSSLSKNLKANGFETFSDINQAPLTAVETVDGIGEQRMAAMRTWGRARSVGDIRGVGTTLAEQLQDRGLFTPVDITAVEQAELVSIDGIGASRAEQIQARAAAWLPPQYELPDRFVADCQPPYGSLAEATEKLAQLESLHHRYARIQPLLTEIDHDDTPVTIPDRCDVTQLLLTHELSQTQATAYELAESVETPWESVFDEVLAYNETDGWGAELSSRAQSEFGLSPLRATEIDIATLCSHESAMAATEWLSDRQLEAAHNHSFVQIVERAIEIQDIALEGDFPEADTLTAALETRVTSLRANLYTEAFSAASDQARTYLSACERALHLANRYPEYPFASAIATLVEQEQTDSPSGDTVTDLGRILAVSDDALELLETLDFDHPAVDSDSWEESITLALDQQYAQAIEPIANQLSRLEGGIWEPDDFGSYDWQGFEQLIAALYADSGYDATVTQSSADMGVDVWATDDETRLAIQVKHYQAGQTVGRETVQKVVSTLAKGDADRALVVTSGEFAGTAQQYADDFGPELALIDATQLVERLSKSSIPPEAT